MGKAPAKNHNFNDVLSVFFNIIYKVLSFSVIFQHILTFFCSLFTFFCPHKDPGKGGSEGGMANGVVTG